MLLSTDVALLDFVDFSLAAKALPLLASVIQEKNVGQKFQCYAAFYRHSSRRSKQFDSASKSAVL